MVLVPKKFHMAIQDSREKSAMDRLVENARNGFVEPVDLSHIKMPTSYTCSNCKIHGHKLWRQYQTIADRIELLCVRCAEKDQKTTLYFRSLHCGERMKSDQIGGLVPALPTDDTYWGYTSAPEDIVQWWYSLPM